MALSKVTGIVKVCEKGTWVLVQRYVWLNAARWFSSMCVKGTWTKESLRECICYIWGCVWFCSWRHVLLALEARWITFVSENRHRLCIILLFFMYIIKEPFTSCVLESLCFT